MADIDIRDAFFDKLYELGRVDRDLIIICDDMDAWGLRKFKRELPKQFINIGVAEQNLIDVAAGLATCGKKVFVYGICSFVTMRCFEQIRFSVCSMNLPVTIVGVGTGFSFSFDGPTHHGTSDVAIMRTLPEMVIYNPCDSKSAKAAAILGHESKRPVYIRLDKGIFPELYGSRDNLLKGFKIIKKLSRINIVSTGVMTHQAVRLAKYFEDKSKDIGVIDLFRIKPIVGDFYKEVIANSGLIIALEENSLTGGIGSSICELIADNRNVTALKRIAVRDKQFFDYGSRDYLLSLSKLDFENLVKRIAHVIPDV